ncbi:BTB/POZ domain-containing protein [Iris pallida]|uniref:BTB/POZ domain-containing protein n=1 Tax=Iris pallida TaxID=29817 RepID=A0AAX6GBZ6_IRIPA|nr:BTB/POZ domain-containing protein [Iris pallida]
MGVATLTETKQLHSVSGKRMAFRPSSSSRHTSADWPLSDVTSDLTVEVGKTSFALHKFPLVSRSGKFQKIVSESKDTKLVRVSLQGMPGGAEAFELAAKFCYGVPVDLTLSNAATLCCAAHYLQMTEEFADNNLELRSESFLREAVLPSIASSISALHHCESLLPAAEEIGLVPRIIASIASNVCKEQLASGLSKLERNASLKPTAAAEAEQTPDWWGRALGALGLDFFQRLLSALKSRGLKQETIGRILIIYAHASLHGLGGRDVQPPSAEAQRKQRAVVEAVAGLLPTQSRRSPVPIAFLSGLLKTATAVSASSACRGDLERRIGMQLHQAILEDVLIPAAGGGQLYDTEAVVRIFSVFLNLEEEEEEEGGRVDESGGCCEYDCQQRSPEQSSVLKVSKLLDSYLAEIALDSNLTPSRFIALAELLPDHARVVNDGLYRAVDIFLKVHPNIKESERYRLCKTIDCQKLSQEACSHAAQNERLPVQMAVQVLYFEQIRLRNAMNGGSHDHFFFGSSAANGHGHGHYPQRSGSGVGSGAISPRDNYASVRRENRELKLEVARMRMRLTDLEKDHVSMKQELVKTNPANKMIKSFTKKFSKLNALFRMREAKPLNPKAASDARLLFQKRRRHSIS